MEEKVGIYQECEQKLVAMLSGEKDDIVKMATISSVLSGAFTQFFWTGFYRFIGGELIVGPYQGTPACTRIKVGRGVCGTVVSTGEALVVPDVHAFDGHIACDAASNSEIVVPVMSGATIIAVLDIDSTEFGAFDEIDLENLERILALFF